MDRSYRKKYIPHPHHRIEILLSMVEMGGSVLNLGDKNNSPITRELRKMNKSVKTLDLENSDIRYEIGEDPLPFKNKSFDCVVAGEIFEHVFHLRKLLKEVKRVLKKGGYLVMTTPNSVSLVDRAKVLIGKLPTNCATGDCIEDHGHVRDFNWDMARRYLREAGFKIVEEKTDGVIFRNKNFLPHSPKTWGNCIIIKARI